MGVCLSVAASMDEDTQRKIKDLQAQVQQRDQQIASLGGKVPTTPAVQQPTSGGNGFTEVLFFPDAAMPCRNGSNCRRGPSCTYSHSDTSLAKLLRCLGSARSTLDICVFTITCNEISDVIKEAHRRNVRVRVITDNDQMMNQGSDVAELRQAGIAVRHDRDAAHMHHKFCLVDGRLVVNGSFNWTRQAVLGNQENVVISDNGLLVSNFETQFERMWAMYQGTDNN